jgi:MFS transporter, BCD family, chlorophyll transporter
VAFAIAARVLSQGMDPCRLAAYGLVVGLPAFTAVLLAAPLDSPLLFRAGALMIGFGAGLSSVGTLTAAMSLDTKGGNGLALGAWGAVQATGAGLAIASAGIIRDLVTDYAMQGGLGRTLATPAIGYDTVYYIEILLILASLVAIGPLARHTNRKSEERSAGFDLAQQPS